MFSLSTGGDSWHLTFLLMRQLFHRLLSQTGRFLFSAFTSFFYSQDKHVEHHVEFIRTRSVHQLHRWELLHRLTFTRIKCVSVIREILTHTHVDSVQAMRLIGSWLCDVIRCTWTVSGFLHNPSGLMKYEKLLIIAWMINVWRWHQLLSVDSLCVWLIIFCLPRDIKSL